MDANAMEETLLKIDSICNKVANVLGKGYNETIYQEAICTELRKTGMPYAKEVVLQVEYEGLFVGNVRADIILPRDSIVIECKAVDSELRDAHLPQIVAYMNILKYDHGVFVNFIQHPGKCNVQIFNIRKKDGIFTFTETHPATTTPKTLDTIGNTVVAPFDPEGWFTENIERDTTGMLTKSECKALVHKDHIKSIIDYIEDKCEEKFKDRQINGVKHTGVIRGWRLKH